MIQTKSEMKKTLINIHDIKNNCHSRKIYYPIYLSTEKRKEEQGTIDIGIKDIELNLARNIMNIGINLHTMVCTACRFLAPHKN